MPTASRTQVRIPTAGSTRIGSPLPSAHASRPAPAGPAVMPRFLQRSSGGLSRDAVHQQRGAAVAAAAGLPRYLQARLEVSQPGDPHEQEADRVAEQVMRMPDHAALQPGAADSEGRVQRKTDASPGSSSASFAPNKLTQSGAGQSLDTQARAYFEPRFGRDFGGVRVHTDVAAAQAARDINAKAYTMGRDIVFGAGRYAPATHEGGRLLAHELAHVVQQGDTRGSLLQREVDQGGATAAAPAVPYFVDFDIKGGWNADEVLSHLQTLVTVPEELATAIREGPAKTAGYCLKLLEIIKANGATHDANDGRADAISRALFSRWNELYHATRNSPLRYSDLAQLAAWGAEFSSPEPAQVMEATNSEPVVEVPVQNAVEWNEQYAAAYKKKRPKGDSAEADFQAERMSGRVKRASSIAGIRVKTTLSEDQVRRIIVAGGEKVSADRCAAMADKISEAFETLMIDTAQAQADYLGHLAGETGGVLEEVEGEKRSYAPFQGRGAVQITGPEIYAKALGTLQQRRDQIAAQLTSGAAKEEANALRQQLMQLDEAINAIKADPKAAADKRYAFLLSAANMHKTGAVGATSRMGATAVFAGNGPADSWVSGGNKGMTFDARKAENEKELTEWQDNLATEKQNLATAADAEAAKLIQKRIENLEAGIKARKTLIQDMISAKSRARIKAAVYAAGVRILSEENGLDSGLKAGP